MQSKEVVASSIRAQNDILMLAAQRQLLKEQTGDLKDLMRKLREREIVLSSSRYCLVAGVLIKKQPQQVYSTLEQEAGRLGKAKKEVEGRMLAAMKCLLGLIREKKVGRDSLDQEVLALLIEFEDSHEEEMLTAVS
jgi:cell division protein ZapA (FtsZ GTPase activity inhibitor)